MRGINIHDVILPFGLLDRISRDMAGNLMSYFICFATVEITKKAMKEVK